jgi:hypothetical protein
LIETEEIAGRREIDLARMLSRASRREVTA